MCYLDRGNFWMCKLFCLKIGCQQNGSQPGSWIMTLDSGLLITKKGNRIDENLIILMIMRVFLIMLISLIMFFNRGVECHNRKWNCHVAASAYLLSLRIFSLICSKNIPEKEMIQFWIVLPSLWFDPRNYIFPSLGYPDAWLLEYFWWLQRKSKIVLAHSKTVLAYF